MQRLTIGEIVFIGLCHLQTFVGTYEQFISVLWNNSFLLATFVSLYGTAPRNRIKDNYTLMADIHDGNLFFAKRSILRLTSGILHVNFDVQLKRMYRSASSL